MVWIYRARYSIKSANWLRFEQDRRGVQIRSALSGGEKRLLGKYKVDGFIEPDICLEFMYVSFLNQYSSETSVSQNQCIEPVSFCRDCYWHGCPECVKKRDMSLSMRDGLTAHTVYTRTVARTQELRKAGFKVRILISLVWSKSFSGLLMSIFYGLLITNYYRYRSRSCGSTSMTLNWETRPQTCRFSWPRTRTRSRIESNPGYFFFLLKVIFFFSLIIQCFLSGYSIYFCRVGCSKA